MELDYFLYRVLSELAAKGSTNVLDARYFNNISLRDRGVGFDLGDIEHELDRFVHEGEIFHSTYGGTFRLRTTSTISGRRYFKLDRV